MRWQYLFFDLDGTLTDPMLGITRSVQYALRHFGIEVTDLSTLCPFIGPPLKDSFREFYGMDDARAEEAIALTREYFAPKGIFENELYAGIPQLLEALRQGGARIAMATSKPAPFARRIAEHFAIDRYFDLIEGSTLDGTRTTKSEVGRRHGYRVHRGALRLRLARGARAGGSHPHRRRRRGAGPAAARQPGVKSGATPGGTPGEPHTLRGPHPDLAPALGSITTGGNRRRDSKPSRPAPTSRKSNQNPTEIPCTRPPVPQKPEAFSLPQGGLGSQALSLFVAARRLGFAGPGALSLPRGSCGRQAPNPARPAAKRSSPDAVGRDAPPLMPEADGGLHLLDAAIAHAHPPAMAGSICSMRPSLMRTRQLGAWKSSRQSRPSSQSEAT